MLSRIHYRKIPNSRTILIVTIDYRKMFMTAINYRKMYFSIMSWPPSPIPTSNNTVPTATIDTKNPV